MNVTAVIDVAKRTYGTGSLFVKHGAWYGRWWSDGEQVTRKLGPKKEGRKDGLSQTQANAKLHEMRMIEAGATPTDSDAPTVKQLGEMLVEHLKRANRKKSTIETVTYHHSKHIDPLLGHIPANMVDEKDVQRLIKKMDRLGRAPKTQRNVIGTLHSSLGLVRKRDNPCDMATLPRVRRNRKIRYLLPDELERVLMAEPGDDDEAIIASYPPEAKWGGPKAARTWWPVVRLLILTSALSGMRLGELRGWRWCNLDLKAMKIRVDETFVRGQFDLPKSDASSRSLPLAKRVLDELNEHHKHTAWNRDEDLVFAHPITGRPLDRVRLLLHVKAACRRAGVREIRVHDLRHTFGTLIASSGKVPLRTLQAWYGHEHITTTEIYAAHMPQPFENELLDGAIETALRCTNGAQISTTPTHNAPSNAP